MAEKKKKERKKRQTQGGCPARPAQNRSNGAVRATAKMPARKRWLCGVYGAFSDAEVLRAGIDRLRYVMCQHASPGWGKALSNKLFRRRQHNHAIWFVEEFDRLLFESGGYTTAADLWRVSLRTDQSASGGVGQGALSPASATPKRATRLAPRAPTVALQEPKETT